MTEHQTSTQGRAAGPFEILLPYQFVRLTTFRKSGVGVDTTVWFAPDDQGKLYVTTSKTAGKIKRVRNNGRVLLTPSDRVGNIVDNHTHVEGTARELAPEEYQSAYAALERKYGEQFIAVIQRMPNNGNRTYMEIIPMTNGAEHGNA